MVNFSIKSVLVLSVMMTSLFAQAQNAGRPVRPPVVGGDSVESRIIRLERGMGQLQRENDDLNHRLRTIEDLLDGRGGYPPPANLTYACMLTDSGFSKTFLAEGKSSLDAEFNVKRECEKTVHASYCVKGAIKCDSNMDSRARGFICMLTDSGFSKTFRGEGATLVAAEANAKISCQGSVHASYCVKNAPRCEEVY